MEGRLDTRAASRARLRSGRMLVFRRKNTIATNYEILHDEEDSRRLLFASVCTLDGIPKPTSGASGMWTLSAPPSPIALVNGELQEADRDHHHGRRVRTDVG